MKRVRKNPVRLGNRPYRPGNIVELMDFNQNFTHPVIYENFPLTKIC